MNVRQHYWGCRLCDLCRLMCREKCSACDDPGWKRHDTAQARAVMKATSRRAYASTSWSSAACACGVTDRPADGQGRLVGTPWAAGTGVSRVFPVCATSVTGNSRELLRILEGCPTRHPSRAPSPRSECPPNAISFNALEPRWVGSRRCVRSLGRGVPSEGPKHPPLRDRRAEPLPPSDQVLDRLTRSTGCHGLAERWSSRVRGRRPWRHHL
jgi:hypothetical protein